MNEEKIQNRDFEKLKQIGIEQIKKDTKLDLARIADILEKRFEKFDYVRAKGFINILEKEYRLDLSDWLEEYHLANPSNDHEENIQEIQEEYCKQLKQKKQIFISIGVGIVCLVAFACFYLLKSNTFQPQQAQTHQILSNQNESNPSEILSDTSMQEPLEELQKNTQLQNMQTVETQTNVQVNQSPLSKTNISNLGSSIFNDLTIVQGDILSLEFERPIWVGTIDLESKKKIAQTQEKYEFPLDKDMVFYVAYGNFLLSINGEEKKYKTYNPIFLIYTQEGGVKQLTKDEYLLIKGGVEW